MTALPPTAFEPQRPSLSTGLAILGILGIVLGSLGALSNFVCGVGTMIAVMLFGHMIPDEFATGFPEGAMAIASLALGVVNGIVSIMLLIAGIGIMRRRASGVRLYQLWAVVRIVFVLIGAPVTYMTQVASLEAQAESGMGMGGASALVVLPMTIFGLIWGLLLPVFALFWLRQKAVIDEVAAWSPADESNPEPRFGHL